jgi:hypothetical protein
MKAQIAESPAPVLSDAPATAPAAPVDAVPAQHTSRRHALTPRMNAAILEEKPPAEGSSTISSDPALQELLMRLTGTLNRRRAYAGSHPMVQMSEEQLFEAISSMVKARHSLAVGVAKTDLLISGEPYITRSSFARELAMRLHRRGVGAITFLPAITLDQLRQALTWLATEVAGNPLERVDTAPLLAGITITRVAYDQLVLGDAERAAEASGERLWRTLARLAADTNPGSGNHPAITDERSAGVGFSDDPDAGGPATPVDRESIVASIRKAVGNPDVARRTALALMELAQQGAIAPPELRSRIGDQLFNALERLGESSFSPIVKSLGEKAVQQQFTAQVVDVLPVATVTSWLQTAANANEQQLSHHMLRLMTKLSTFADDGSEISQVDVFRNATRDLVNGWSLDDPNPEEHVALLDRIAMHERTRERAEEAPASSTLIESSRLVQMALEIDVPGDDAGAAAESLVSSGKGSELMDWIISAGDTRAAAKLRDVARGDRAVKQLLLTEPVDRLQARALLESLDITSVGTLIDVLGASEARGTRMIVRQRLAEYGPGITSRLVSRLDDAPWYLVRNILTLLHEFAENTGGESVDFATMTALLEHPQFQVRVEAFRVLMLQTSTRENTLRQALRDTNERMVNLALQQLVDLSESVRGYRLSDSMVSQLLSMVDGERHRDAVKARMIRALGISPNARVRDWLISLLTRKTKILRRMTLVDPTPVAVAALLVLQRTYQRDPIAEPILALARREGNDPRWHARDFSTGTETL